MGKHYLLNLYGCPFDKLDNYLFLIELLENAAAASGATVCETIYKQFEPQGVTVLSLLSESHISIHTWPEKGMAVCDAFTCGDHTTPEKGVEYMQKMLESTDIIMNEFIRPLE